MLRFAANLSLMFTERPFLDRFEAAAASGFEAVEFLFPYDHPLEKIADRLAEAKLELALFNLPPGDWAAGERGLAALPGRAEEFRRSVGVALSYAARLGAGRLHLMAGLAPAGDQAALESYLDALSFACDEAGPRGVDILIEPINGRDMPGYFLNDFARAAEIVEKLRRPNLKLQFDVYHRQILHGDVVRGLEALIGMIGHVQIASVPNRNEPNTGELDDRFVLAALERLGYDGFVGCEYRPAGITEAGLSWLQPYRDAASRSG
jgi:hydroxypyruvate isomerase